MIEIKMRVPFIASYGNDSVGSWSLYSLRFSLEKELKPRLPRAPLLLRHVLWAPAQVRGWRSHGDVCSSSSFLPGGGGHFV